eukprot:8250762-Pyramimonas_sp.AAC.1
MNLRQKLCVARTTSHHQGLFVAGTSVGEVAQLVVSVADAEVGLCVLRPQSDRPPVASQCLLPSVVGSQHCAHLHVRVEVF